MISADLKNALSHLFVIMANLIKYNLVTLIKGWDVGVKGTKVGGKRQLTVPSKLGYGRRGSPPEIPGDATLCFEVKLLAVS